MKQLILSKFSNRLALEMGLKIVELAKEKGLKIGVAIERIDHPIFVYLDDDLPKDKHNWLRRKSNVAKHFEESSLSVKEDLIAGDMTLDGTFALSNKDYAAHGGSIPIMIKDVGMIGTVTVTGLPDVEDHQLIVDALKDYM